MQRDFEVTDLDFRFFWEWLVFGLSLASWLKLTEILPNLDYLKGCRSIPTPSSSSFGSKDTSFVKLFSSARQLEQSLYWCWVCWQPTLMQAGKGASSIWTRLWVRFCGSKVMWSVLFLTLAMKVFKPFCWVFGRFASGDRLLVKISSPYCYLIWERVRFF